MVKHKNSKRWLISLDGNSQEYLPGPSLFKFVGFFRIGLTLFWAVSAILLLSSCSQVHKSRLASKYFPSEIYLQQIIQENTALSLSSLPEFEVTELWKKKGEKLIWVNFNTPKLCGQAGCAYSLYLFTNRRELERVWEGYLNPHLPPNIPLLKVNSIDQKEQVYPCLSINQLNSVTSTSSLIRETILCWQGNSYQIQTSRLMSLN